VRTVHRQRLAILGDSVMVDGSPGVQAILQSTRVVTVLPRAAPGYGLSKADWRTDFTRILDETKPTAIAVLLGGFDLQYAAAHPDIYQQTVGSVMDLLTARGEQVAWVGMLPSDAQFTNDGLRRNLNAIVQRAAATRPHVHYTIPDPTFDGPDGKYAMFLPDAAGKLVRIRKVDGEHLCPDGAARLGQLVYDTLRRALRLPPPAKHWQNGAWRRDALYTASNAYDARTLHLTTDVCPPR
jgi:hypothetical protein